MNGRSVSSPGAIDAGRSKGVSGRTVLGATIIVVMMRRVAILGAGGMGTALAVLFRKTVRSVQLWSRDAAHAAELARDAGERPPPARHPRCPRGWRSRPTPATRPAGPSLIVVAIPSAFLRATLDGLSERIPPGIPVLSVVKGIENATFARPSQIVVETLGTRSVAVLSGPSHAEELARGLPASVVVGGATRRSTGRCATP